MCSKDLYTITEWSFSKKQKNRYYYDSVRKDREGVRKFGGLLEEFPDKTDREKYENYDIWQDKQYKKVYCL